jgi:hypothetical protein
MKDKNGKLIGFEIDVATRLASDLGVKVEFVPTAWSGIIPALLTGKFDVIIGGMGITPQRSLKVNFSIPYDYSGMSLVAHRQLAAGFTTLADFNRTWQVAVKPGRPPPRVKNTCPRPPCGCSTTRPALSGTALARSMRSSPMLPADLRPSTTGQPIRRLPRLCRAVFRPAEATRTPNLFQQLDRPGGDGRLAKERHDYWFGTRTGPVRSSKPSLP